MQIKALAETIHINARSDLRLFYGDDYIRGLDLALYRKTLNHIPMNLDNLGMLLDCLTSLETGDDGSVFERYCINMYTQPALCMLMGHGIEIV
jgi:hypothetical protein